MTASLLLRLDGGLNAEPLLINFLGVCYQGSESIPNLKIFEANDS